MSLGPMKYKKRRNTECPEYAFGFILTTYMFDFASCKNSKKQGLEFL
jgi:hypothetical protein